MPTRLDSCFRRNDGRTRRKSDKNFGNHYYRNFPLQTVQKQKPEGFR